MRVPTEYRLSQWLTAHLRNLQHWTDPQTGRIFDPVESHRHDLRSPVECGTLATALVVAATTTRLGLGQLGPLISSYCRRITDILRDETTPPLAGLSLQYFGLLAGTQIRALAIQSQPVISSEDADSFVRALCDYQDHLEVPTSATCAAMQAGVRMLRQLHTGQTDWEQCKDYLNIVAGQQTQTGFINDDLAGPSMPVAYHMLCMYLLAAAVCRLDLASLPEQAKEPLDLANRIVTRGYAWLGHLLANDGMFAQYGHGKYHVSSQAAGVALLAAAGMEADDAAIRRYMAWMDRYRLTSEFPDGSPTSMFAVTPNLCPQAMRVGFDAHGTVTACNNLAMSILLDAWAWWTGVLPQLPGANEAHRAFFNAAREPGCFGDAQTGLIRLRSRAGYALVNLSGDFRGTTPAGSLMHLRLGDDLHERALAPPFWADPRVAADAPEQSVWEGPLLCDKAQPDCDRCGPPAFLVQGRTLECRSTPSMLILRGEGPEANWSKTIILEPPALQLQWQLALKAAGGKLFAAVPCLLWDGVNQTQLRFDGSQVQAVLAGKTWRLRILDAHNQPWPGEWYLTPYRSMLSTSGVTGRLLLPLTESIQPNQEIAWTIRIEQPGNG